MKISPIAFQITSIRDFRGDEPDFVRSPRGRRSIGCEAFDLAVLGSVVWQRAIEIVLFEGLRGCTLVEFQIQPCENPGEFREQSQNRRVKPAVFPCPRWVGLAGAAAINGLVADVCRAAEVFAVGGSRLPDRDHAFECVQAFATDYRNCRHEVCA